jgi:hypothetical protein
LRNAERVVIAQRLEQRFVGNVPVCIRSKPTKPPEVARMREVVTTLSDDGDPGDV